MSTFKHILTRVQVSLPPSQPLGWRLLSHHWSRFLWEEDLTLSSSLIHTMTALNTSSFRWDTPLSATLHPPHSIKHKHSGCHRVQGELLIPYDYPLPIPHSACFYLRMFTRVFTLLRSALPRHLHGWHPSFFGTNTQILTAIKRVSGCFQNTRILLRHYKAQHL